MKRCNKTYIAYLAWSKCCTIHVIFTSIKPFNDPLCPLDGDIPSCGGFCSHHILNPLKHLCFVLHWCFKQCFPSHHQRTRSGDIFWTGGVNPGSWAPETCQIPLKIVEVSCALSHGLGNLRWFFFTFFTHLKVMKFSWTKLISEKMCLNVCICKYCFAVMLLYLLIT